MESTLIGLVISGFVPKLLEWLKSKRWAVFIQPYAPALNTVTAALVAFATAIGVSVDFDVTAGRLVIDGLIPEVILRTGLTWLLNFAVQETVYRRFIHIPSSSTPRP